MKGRLICSLPFFDAIYQSAGKVFRFRGEVAAATSVGEGATPPAVEFALFESAGKDFVLTHGGFCADARGILC